MAKITAQIAMAIGPQATEGVADPTIAALATTVTNQDGLVIGDRDAGVLNSGISLEIARIFDELADVPGSFTKQPSTFLRADPGTFSFAWQLKGNGATISGTPADAEYDLEAPTAGGDAITIGIDTILKASGLTGAAWAGGVGWVYTPAAPGLATAKIWWGDMAVIIADIRANLSIEYTPGGVAIATATLAGVVDSKVVETFPSTITPGNLSGVAAPVLESAGNTFEAARGFESFTLTIDNGIEDIPDSNVAGGVVKEQTERSITGEMKLIADSVSGIDMEYDELIRATAPTVPLTFENGAAAGIGALAIGHQINLPNPEVRSWVPDTSGTKAAHTIELAMVDTAQDGEFALIFH